MEEYWKTHFRRKQALVKVQKSTPRKQCKSELPILVNPLLIVRNHGSFVLACDYSEIASISAMDVMQEASPQLMIELDSTPISKDLFWPELFFGDLSACAK